MKTISKNLLVMSIAILLVSICSSQATPWQQSSQWTLYNIRGGKFYKIALDSLDRYTSRSLNDDSMQTFLSHSIPMRQDKPPVWMGAYVTSCVIDQKKRKIDISSYGGFLFDETETKYYSLPQEMQKDWLNYLAASAGAIPAQK